MKRDSDSVLIADVHSHILPGLDDGAEDLRESIEMLKKAAEEGITHIICTPHFKRERHNASTATIRERLQELSEAAEENNIAVSLYVGNEVLYFSDIEQALIQKQIFTMNDSQYILLEFSPGDQFRYIRNAVNEVIGIGYYPIVAHVERYECMVRHPEYVEELRGLGARIQINASSVTGDAGWKVKRYAARLLENEEVDYIATDAHESGRRGPYMKKCRSLICKKYGEQCANALLFENARRDFLL